MPVTATMTATGEKTMFCFMIHGVNNLINGLSTKGSQYTKFEQARTHQLTAS